MEKKTSPKLTSVIVLFLLTTCTVIIGEYCDWNLTVPDYFYCSGLNVESAEYVRSSLLEIPPGSSISLYCNRSDLSELPNDLFNGYQVTYFICNLCELEIFPFGAMQSFGPNLEEIYVVSSSVGTISGGFVEALPFRGCLFKIVIDHGTIWRIDQFAFSQFSALTGLYIASNMRIDMIEDYAFVGIPKLEYLSLAENELPYLSRNAMGNLSSLHYLYLSVNQLTTLQPGTLNDQDFPNLQNLWLFDNPWYCNCSLQWLKDYINEHPNIDLGYGEPICSQPRVAAFNEVDFCSW